MQRPAALFSVLALALTTFAVLCLGAPAPKIPVSQFLRGVNHTLSVLDRELNEAQWNYNTNLTDENNRIATEVELRWNDALLKLVKQALDYDENTPGITPDQLRQLYLLKLFGGVPFEKKDQEELSKIANDMTAIYSKGVYNGMSLDPDLTKVMAESRNYDELLRVFIGWRNVTGPAIRPLYARYIRLSNAAAQQSGFKDTGVLWRSGYDMDVKDFDKMVEELWEQVLPLYEQLHCYVRARLQKVYGEDKVSSDGFIPAHLLGNMWAQDWSNIYTDILRPYTDVPSIDVTPALQAKGYDAVKIHKLSEDFYKSLGYDPLPDTFWTKSMLVKPQDRDVVCHASAWDLSQNDLRIKMCTSVNQEDMLTAHHEQGHLFYDHYYRNHTYLYRSGANDGFHEAIGDTIQLSTTVPHHLNSIGLLDDASESPEGTINFQMLIALQKVAFLPFGFLIDQWRWKVMSGEIPETQYNAAWWELVQKYQGLSAPALRSELDFDPGSKFHVPANVPYMRYFLAHILQFQFHRALCGAAGLDGPLHNCSIYGSAAAGQRYKDMLSLGRSLPWQEALKAATRDTRGMDASAILDYFAPLLKWLRTENAGRKCGWPGSRG